MHFAADDEMDVPCLFECRVDDRQVDLVWVEDVRILLTWMVGAVEAEAEVEDELALEVQAALVENVRE